MMNYMAANCWKMAKSTLLLRQVKDALYYIDNYAGNWQNGDITKITVEHKMEGREG